MHKHLSCLALDIIGKTSFSYDFNFCQNVDKLSDPMFDMFKSFQDLCIQTQKRTTSWEVFWPLLGVSVPQLAPLSAPILERIAAVVSSKRESLDTFGPADPSEMDLLDRIMDDSCDPFTDAELQDELFAFFFAGHEVFSCLTSQTTANSLTYAVKELCSNKRVLDALRAEIDDLIDKHDELQANHIALLPYHECFLKEVLRLYPVIPALRKTALRDTYFAGYKIRKGSQLMPNIRHIQISEKYWTDPLVFQPERWQNGFVPVPGSFMPFGEGPTNCIGQKLVMIEMKIAIAKIVRCFDFELVPDQQLREICSVTVGLKEGMLVTIKQRG